MGLSEESCGDVGNKLPQIGLKTSWTSAPSSFI